MEAYRHDSGLTGKGCRTRVLLICIFGLLLAAGSARAEYIYSVLSMDLSNPQVFGIDSSGKVVGTGGTETSFAGFTYTAGSLEIVLPAGWTESYAYGISSNGYVAGFGVSGDEIHKGFMYDGISYTELLPAGYDAASALGVNSSGSVAGDGYGAATGYANRGFMYTPGTPDPFMELLPAGWADSWATGINDAGTVVGYGLDDEYLFRGFIYDGSTYTELLPPGWSEAYAMAVNGTGEVVGYGTEGDVVKGFIFDGSSYRSLLPEGWLSAQAVGINGNGAVVGSGTDAEGKQKGFVFLGGAYSDIIPGEDWVDAMATGINDSGVIAGWGTDQDGKVKGFTAAVPAPATLLLLSSGLIGLSWMRAGRKGK